MGCYKLSISITCIPLLDYIQIFFFAFFFKFLISLYLSNCTVSVGIHLCFVHHIIIANISLKFAVNVKEKYKHHIKLKPNIYQTYDMMFDYEQLFSYETFIVNF